MNYKTLLVACIALNITFASKADLKEDLKTRVEQVKAFAQSEKAGQIAKVTAGGLSMGLGVCFGGMAFCELLFGTEMNKILMLTVTGAGLSAVHCGYDKFNEGLRNKPNDAIKSFLQNAKALLQELKLNKQL